MIHQKGKYFTREILKQVDEICRNNQISYTLLFTALLAQEEERGESSWLSDICIGLLYPEYIKLVNIIKNDRQSNLYIVNRENNVDYNAFFTQVCMRSRVQLPDLRKEDEVYYSYSIYVYPIIYAGNTLSKYFKTYIKLKFYNKCVVSLAPAPFMKGIKGKRKALIRKWWVRKRNKKKTEMNIFLEEFFRNGMIPSKYIIVPGIKKQPGLIRLAKTYESVEDKTFENQNVMCIANKKDWLKRYYNKHTRKKIMNSTANKAVLDGPETIRRVQLVALDILCEFDRICKKNNISYIISAGTLLGAIRHGGFIPWDDDVDVFMLNEEWEKFVGVASRELNQEKFFLRTQETDTDDNLVFGQIKRNNTIYVKEKREQFRIHRGIALDILPFYNSPDTKIAFFIQDRLCHFLKTVTWAHMGYVSVDGGLQKWYYHLLSRVSNKKSFHMYYNIANIVKTPKPYLSYLCVSRNPYHKGFNQRKYFEDLTEVEFEGYKFPAPREFDEYLKYLYGNDYMKLPMPLKRVNHHLPGNIELNGLYEYEE